MRKEQPVRTEVVHHLPIVEASRVIRKPRQVPVLKDNALKRGLWFESGKFHVYAHELNGRGVPTGKLVRMGSYKKIEDAQTLRDEINTQHPAFQAQIEADERENPDRRVIDEPSRRNWEGAVPMQYGPWYVDATMLDQYHRRVGWGIISYFRDQTSAEACAATLNAENPKFEATASPDPEFHED